MNSYKKSGILKRKISNFIFPDSKLIIHPTQEDINRLDSLKSFIKKNKVRKKVRKLDVNICSECGVKFTNFENICSLCGMDVKKHNCSRKIKKNLHYCPDCGYNLKEESLDLEIEDDDLKLLQNKTVKIINHNHCENCGAKLEDNEKSCRLCGMGENERIISFRNAKIPRFEANVLIELERIAGKIFTFVKKTGSKSKMEFSTFRNRVIEISMCYCEFDILPESIDRLQFLEKLNLRWNYMKKVPKSIGNLKSLKILNLNHNNLFDLPETIDNLPSLENLSFKYNFIDTQKSSLIKDLIEKGVKITK